MFSNGCLDLSVNLLIGNMVLVQNVQKPFGSISSQMPAFSLNSALYQCRRFIGMIHRNMEMRQGAFI